MKRFMLVVLAFFAVASIFPFSAIAADYITQSKRQIPVIDKVDVVVVGGSTAGVAAATEAASAGADVYLVAPKAYLGEDICSAYRYTLKRDIKIEDPLARKIFAEPEFVMQTFSYQANVQSDRDHADTMPGTMLNDGMWATAGSQSVQYSSDVMIRVDLGEEVLVPSVHVMTFQRPGDFMVDTVEIALSDDGNQWKKVKTLENSDPEGMYAFGALDFKTEIGQKARYLLFKIKKPEDARRILLGEIVIEKPLKQEAAAQQYRLPPRPMQVKMELEKALIDNKVKFIYRSHVSDVIKDGKGNAAGVVIANRAGRQAIIAKAVIDATKYATVCRSADVEFTPFKPGKITFERVLVGSDVIEDQALKSQEIFFPVSQRPGLFNARLYKMDIELSQDSYQAISEAEQLFRDKTFNKKQLDASENIFFLPPSNVKCKKTVDGSWPGAEKVDLDVFAAKACDGLYVLSGYADISRDEVEKMYQPIEYISVGRVVGKKIATKVSGISEPENLNISGKDVKAQNIGEVREVLRGLRAFSKGLETISCDEQSIPVIDKYDVVVIGGGTGGAPAGISAARKGAKTLVVEYLHDLGGVATVGLIGRYHHGYEEGFTAELDNGVREIGGQYAQKGREWNPEIKQEWLRKELRKAGGDIWFDSIGCGAIVKDGKFSGVIVATPYGRVAVTCDIVIDSTGNSDIARAAGAEVDFVSDKHSGMQGTGYPPFNLGAMYTNTDYLIVDESDMVDVTRASIVGKETYSLEYDMSPCIDTRERRRIVGEYTLTPLDIVTNRTFDDTVVWASSNFDSHGFANFPLLHILHPDPYNKGVFARVPFRCLMPKDLKGILVTGLGVSAHRDAAPIIRMEPDVQNQGYAAGLAAAISSKSNTELRKLDVRQLQQMLVDKGNLPMQILYEEDANYVTQPRLEKAIREITENPIGIALFFVEPDKSRPMLKKAYAEANDDFAKSLFARVLAIMGDDTGIDTLIANIKSYDKWDVGFKWRSQGYKTPYARSMSELDSIIICAGFTKNKKAVEPIVEKLKMLDDKDWFTHHRACALALEAIGDKSAAKHLADHLNKKGISGNEITNIDKALDKTILGRYSFVVENTFREIILARALYNCGDYQGKGEQILRNYFDDIRGVYAGNARRILGDYKKD